MWIDYSVIHYSTVNYVLLGLHGDEHQRTVQVAVEWSVDGRLKSSDGNSWDRWDEAKVLQRRWDGRVTSFPQPCGRKSLLLLGPWSFCIDQHCPTSGYISKEPEYVLITWQWDMWADWFHLLCELPIIVLSIHTCSISYSEVESKSFNY